MNHVFRMTRSLAIGLVLLGYSLAPTLAESPDSWPQWRGPGRDGKLTDATWPARLTDENFSLQWRAKLGPSYSGPIVADDRVFVTETKDKQIEIVRALDRNTGKELWSAEWEGAIEVPFFARSNGSWIRSTPTYDNGRLYVGGMRDVLVCLDASTGNQVWRVDFVSQFDAKPPAFGFVCSPLVVGDHLFVQAGACVAKLDKNTGKVLWRALEDGGGMFGSAFSSPSIGNVNGQSQLLVQTRTTLAGVDMDTGAVPWSQEIPAFRGMNILTPTTYDDGVFVSSYGGKSMMLAIKDGEVIERWQNKAQGYMSTPVIIDGHAYLHLRNQRFTCIDLDTGETRWTSKPYGKYCSLVANGNQILALDQRGVLLLIEATPEEFRLVDAKELTNEETWAHLAVVKDQVFVRELNAMAAYRWEGAN